MIASKQETLKLSVAYHGNQNPYILLVNPLLLERIFENCSYAHSFSVFIFSSGSSLKTEYDCFALQKGSSEHAGSESGLGIEGKVGL